MLNDEGCTVEIDGKKFKAFSANVVLSTNKDRAGMPEMGSLQTLIRVCADLSSRDNMPFALVKYLFDLSNIVTRDKIKNMRVIFWTESHDDILFSYMFQGWVSRFETSVITDGTEAPGSHGPNRKRVLILDLEPALNQSNFREVSLTN